MTNEIENIKWVKPLKESSQIAAVGTNPEVPNTLYVRFHKGGDYAYDGVDTSVFTGIKGSSSPGGYLAAHIKGVFPFRKLS